jgi:hypothetical protein
MQERMTQDRVKMIVVLNERHDVITASSVAHVQEEGGWPTIAFLAGGMFLRQLHPDDVQIDGVLRDFLLSDVLLKEHPTPEAAKAGAKTFYEFIGSEGDSPNLIYLSQGDGYSFQVYVNAVLPMEALWVYGELMVVQANIDVHLSRVGQLRAEAMRKMEQQGKGPGGQQILVPGRDGIPPMGSLPRKPGNGGDGGMLRLP